MSDAVTEAPPQTAEQPALEESRHARPADPCAMVIFGASGDLTKRKLLPSLYHLAKKNLLPEDFALVGCAIDDMTEEEFRRTAAQNLTEFGGAPEHCRFCDWLVGRLYYNRGDFRDPATYEQLKAKLGEIDKKNGTGGNYFYYLATSPTLFGEVIQRLGAAGLAE